MNFVHAVVYREYLIRRTSLTWMFFDVMVPLLYLMMFGVAFDRALGARFVVEGMTIRYNDFFLAGVLSMTCFGNAVNQAYGFFIDRDNGIFYEHLTYPMTRGELLIGKILFQGLMSIVQTSLILLAAHFVLDIQFRLMTLPLVFFGVLIGTAGWFFCMSSIAFVIRRNDMFNMIINSTYFVLMFLSSLFYPVDQLPGWLKIPSICNPLTWHADVLRYLTIGTGLPTDVTAQSILFVFFLLLAFLLALRMIRRATN